MLKINKIIYMSDYQLLLRFNTGEIRTIDFKVQFMNL